MAKVLLRRMTPRSVALIVCESAIILAAVAGGAVARLGVDVARMQWEDHGLFKAALVALTCQLCLYFADLYEGWSRRTTRDLVTRLMQALCVASVLLAALYYWFPDLVLGRGVFAIAATLTIGLVVVWRLAFTWFSRRLRPRARLLLVGTNDAAVALARELHEREELGVEIVGFIDPDPAKVGMPVFNPGVVGTIEDIRAVARARSVDRVVVSLNDARGKLPMDKLLEMKLDGVSFDHLASVYEEYTGKIAVETLRPSWLIFSSGCRKTPAFLAAKRALDLVFASLGLMLALPIVTIAAIAVKLTSPGPVFYHQQRVGRDSRVFVVHKIRSMCANAEAATGAVWARANDSRITKVGRFLRRTRIDELPQLWSVLRGDMSLVGPRPERPEFVRDLTKDIRFYGQRHAVRPGLTGWAQVRYTYGASVEQAMQKLQYDLFYIKNMSIALDLMILFETIKTVVLQKGA
jgi:sugar transferase (PEP-CTERM system associated)